MERREFVALLGFASMMTPVPTRADAVAHAEDTLAGRLAGAWSFASSLNSRKDGTTFQRWGDNAKGLLMFDRSGHFSQVIIGSESRVFGSKVFCSIGNYSVDEPTRMLVINIEACSLAKLSGAVQKRRIVLLNADQLKYVNPSSSGNSTAEVVWKRLT